MSQLSKHWKIYSLAYYTAIPSIFLVYGLLNFKEFWAHLDFSKQFLFEDIFLSFILNPYVILNFLQYLVIPVIPLVLCGIWAARYSKKWNTAYNETVLRPWSTLLSCFVPIVFILSCAYSSIKILFFKSYVWDVVNTKILSTLVASKEGLLPFLKQVRELVFWIDLKRVPLISNELLPQFINWVSQQEGVHPHVKQYVAWMYEFDVQPAHNYTDFALSWPDLIYQTLVKNLNSELLSINSSQLIEFPNFELFADFIFDTLTVSIFLVVSLVTFFVIIFAFVYIKDDERRPVFFLLLTLFAGFIMILVASANYLVLFIGWEGVGLTSFLLINFWYTRLQANKAAIKAVLVNRVGDVCLIIALALVHYHTETLDFIDAHIVLLEGLDLASNSRTIELICLFLFLAAVGKSAQLGLHTWLPDAMEGPTPVSALLHAATMVTAGVYLIIRNAPLFNNAPSVSTLISILGLFTALFAATAALLQYDMKKVIAYSTCSQLGYIIFSAGLGQYAVSFFHLFNHAFFKALLFIAAGAVIHSLNGEQDVRRIGGLGSILIFVFLINSIGVLSLSGSFFMSGFYSKDLILETSIATFSVSSLIVYWLALLTALFTGIYSSDSLDDAFFEETNSRKVLLENIHSTSYQEMFVLTILALLSLFSGYIFKDIFVGLGTDFLTGFQQLDNPEKWHLWGTPSSHNIASAEFLPVSIKLLPLVLSLVVGFAAKRYETTVYQSYLSITFLSHKWYFDMLQNAYICYNFLRFSYAMFWQWDKYIFEQFRTIKFKYMK